MNQNTITLHAKEDPTVNSVMGSFETRFIIRSGGDEAIIYLSSAAGCEQSCRMCWLTQSGQTDATAAEEDDFTNQAHESLGHAKRHYVEKAGPKVVHFNFMARGEPLLNPTIMNEISWAQLSENLIRLARAYLGDGVEVKFKISTIMPSLLELDELGTPIGGMTQLPFKLNKPEIYYSLYSVDDKFRRQWLPKAGPVREALRMLSDYERDGGQVRLHGAFILGHNDDLTSVDAMYRSAKFYGLHKKFNIVRFNSPDPEKWIEPEEEDLLEIKKYLESKGVEVQMVPRVGLSVAASCGQFVDTEGKLACPK